jgi:hypothetical protein
MRAFLPAMESTAGRERPWAQGIGLLVLGLVVTAIANVWGQHGDPGSVQRTLGFVGYAGGLVIAGAGVHRVLWVGPTARSRPARIFITVLVTIPTFVLTALVLSVIMSVFQRRFMS